jgi:uncharacterized peroxidase-related enzyme
MARMFLSDPPLDSDVQAMYDRDLAEYGYVNNNTRLWAWRPDVFSAFKQVRVTNGMAMSLTDREFAVVIAATVAQREDAYCSLAWGANLASESGDEVAAAVLSGESPAELTEREAALARWARLVSHDANATSAGDVEQLRAVGFSERDVFEVTALVAFRIAYSTVNDALSALPDRQLAAAAPPEVRAAIGYGRPVDPKPSTSDAER